MTQTRTVSTVARQATPIVFIYPTIFSMASRCATSSFTLEILPRSLIDLRTRMAAQTDGDPLHIGRINRPPPGCDPKQRTEPDTDAYPRSFAGAFIGGAVAHKNGTRQIQIQIALGRQDHARCRFPASAIAQIFPDTLHRVMWTVIHCIELRAVFGENAAHPFH